MKYRKLTNLLDNVSNQPSKFRTKNQIEINDSVRRGAYSPDKQIKFKTSILRFRLCDYSDAYILVKRSITINNTAVDDANENNTNKKIVFKTYVPFFNCQSKINNTEIDDANYIDIVMSM